MALRRAVGSSYPHAPWALSCCVAHRLGGRSGAQGERASIEADSDALLASPYDPGVQDPAITHLDGFKVRRIPGYRKWMWNFEFLKLLLRSDDCARGPAVASSDEGWPAMHRRHSTRFD